MTGLNVCGEIMPGVHYRMTESTDSQTAVFLKNCSGVNPGTWNLKEVMNMIECDYRAKQTYGWTIAVITE